MERMERRANHFTNVYIKNFADSLDDEKLKELFKGYGSILSAKVMAGNGQSKGFGFVCFEDAANAKQVIYMVAVIVK